MNSAYKKIIFVAAIVLILALISPWLISPPSVPAQSDSAAMQPADEAQSRYVAPAPRFEIDSGVIGPPQLDEIPSGAYHNETFSTAPFAWRTAGAAIAEVTNRWECDPRWSFFSLKNNRKAGKAAVLWSKYQYPGDLAVDFNVAIKMEQIERGRPYTYARDINVTICSDGSDLTKGYTFMFGGFGNQGSMILRNGVEVSRHPAKIPTEMTVVHHRWFRFRVEKQGGRLTFRVDNFFSTSDRPDWVYEDPEPLKGDHIAIWTYDNAIMLSRVRLSGQGGQIMDDPSWEPGPLKTPLDGK